MLRRLLQTKKEIFYLKCFSRENCAQICKVIVGQFLLDDHQVNVNQTLKFLSWIRTLISKRASNFFAQGYTCWSLRYQLFLIFLNNRLKLH
jgi:hypothetical protein